ncbi:MAG: T9SS type A sorting domain-containing protein [Bacteroidia bacterium]
MKKFLTAIFIFCISRYAEAQMDSLIYGLASKNSPESVFLAKINTSTGVITNISSLSVATGEQIPGATIDPNTKTYYFIDTADNFAGLNLLTGTIASSHQIVTSDSSYFEQFLYNCADSTIYGLARKSSPPSVFLAKIDPATGIVTNISSSSIATGDQIPNGALDPYNKIYYFANQGGDIVGVSLLTGAVVSCHLMTNAAGTYFDQFLFNCSDSTIYGLASTSSPDHVFLAKVNPATGVITNISTSSVASGEQVPNATIDPFNNIYYFADMSNHIVGLNLSTGAVISTQLMTNVNAAYFDQFIFNTNYIPRNYIAGVENLDALKTIQRIYPVPASNILNIETLQTDNYLVELVNNLGQVELTSKFSSVKSIQLNVSKLKAGIYLLKISGSKNTDVRKIAIEK